MDEVNMFKSTLPQDVSQNSPPAEPSAYRRAFDAFENPTDDASTAVGILEFVSTTLRAYGWAHNPNDGSNADFVLAVDGHEAVRRFRFLAGLVDLAAELSEGGAK